MTYYNTLIPYSKVKHLGIAYGPCTDFDHISRYKGLRQVTHNPTEQDIRFIAPETPNPFGSLADVQYYTVTAVNENRLDLIAENFLGAATYAWVIAYFNNIEDGFTCLEGQRLAIPMGISPLFNRGEILAAISALQLQLGYE